MRFLLKLMGHEFPNQLMAIRYSRAVLCLACDWVTESKNDHCEKCGAKGCYLIHLANRELHRAKGF